MCLTLRRKAQREKPVRNRTGALRVRGAGTIQNIAATRYTNTVSTHGDLSHKAAYKAVLQGHVSSY